MNRIFFFVCSVLVLLIENFSPADSLADAKVNKPQSPNSEVEIQASRNQIVKFTDKGIVPENLRMKKEDSIVFFLNDTSDSLTSLVIEFGDKATHCGGAKMQTGRNGKVSSIRPFGPNDFTSTCFHEAGEYPIKVYGLKKNPKGIESKIYVE